VKEIDQWRDLEIVGTKVEKCIKNVGYENV
jgi:hypothetical protein